MTAPTATLAGVRTFIGGTPQHAVLIGMTGAGKSFAMDDLLTQTQAGYDYTVIIEEGLSYKKFTESLGGRPILIHPDGELTINYLDTQGLAAQPAPNRQCGCSRLENDRRVA